MRSDRTTAIVVGALFITATVASILGSVALGSALDGPDYLVHLADQQGRIILAVLLFLAAASSAGECPTPPTVSSRRGVSHS